MKEKFVEMQKSGIKPAVDVLVHNNFKHRCTPEVGKLNTILMKKSKKGIWKKPGRELSTFWRKKHTLNGQRKKTKNMPIFFPKTWISSLAIEKEEA